jgi:EAL domain-containing protein (putative c-di-GMP-specific phosphodiesterase class I)
VNFSTGLVSQYELLIRMEGSEGDLLPPSAFLPLAERFGLLPELDRWVARGGVELAAQGHVVHVNVSASTLADPGFGADVDRYLDAAAGADENLVFEVTETALIGNEPLALRFFERVRARGCRVAIDDFGSGYGGFRYIKKFAVDYLKVDQEFVRDLETDLGSAKVVEAVVRLAQDFDLETVAEGVENAEVLECLRGLGVTHGQGYFFGQPLAATRLSLSAPVPHRSG